MLDTSSEVFEEQVRMIYGLLLPYIPLLIIRMFG